jgi:chromosome segregation ATPase
MGMQNIERSNQKMLDKIQGIYAELSKRMEEFMIYHAKQDRMEDLLNEVMKNLDDINTKAAYFVTRDDMESLRASMQASAQVPSVPSATEEIGNLKSQKEEIKMLIKSLEEGFKSGATTKEEYENMKNVNLAKLEETENKIKEIESGKGEVPKVIEEKKPEEKPEKIERETTPERKEKDEILLKDLEETFKKGFISKGAYEKTKKMILGKG